MIRKMAKTFAVLMLLVVGLLSYVGIATHHAKSQAEEICTSIPIGTTESAANMALSHEKSDSHLWHSSPTLLSIGFKGAFVERFFCNIQIKDGKVVSSEIRLID
jgi:hypothetical protein